jgi:glycosyltransferase involved in cell wall biosynthesis
MAQNRGIAETSGAWVAFLDDDDMWHPEKVAACAALVESDPEAMAIWHQQCYVISPAYAEWHPGKANTCVLADSLEQAIEGLASRSGDRLTLVPGALPPHLERLGDSRLALLGRMQGGMSAAVVRRDCVITAGCFEPHAKNQDWLFYLNVSRLSPWIEIDRPLGFTRLHDDQDSWGSDYLMPVSARHFVWFGNRPMPGRVTDEERRQLLAKLGPEYRGLISQMLWAAVRGGRYSMAAGVLSMGLPLLPRWRDRMAVVTPRPIAHRLGWL